MVGVMKCTAAGGLVVVVPVVVVVVASVELGWWPVVVLIGVLGFALDACARSLHRRWVHA